MAEKHSAPPTYNAFFHGLGQVRSLPLGKPAAGVCQKPATRFTALFYEWRSDLHSPRSHTLPPGGKSLPPLRVQPAWFSVRSGTKKNGRGVVRINDRGSAARRGEAGAGGPHPSRLQVVVAPHSPGDSRTSGEVSRACRKERPGEIGRTRLQQIGGDARTEGATRDRRRFGGGGLDRPGRGRP